MDMTTTSPKPQEVPDSLRNRKSIGVSDPLDPQKVVSSFTVVTYNILADCHTKPSYYPYREPEFLDQDFRHTLLMKELAAMDADVYCMQEVGSNYYVEKLEPEMRNKGYCGLFVKRTILSYKEGCATFFRISKFALMDNRIFPVDNLAEEAIDAVGITNENFKSRFCYGRGSVLQMTTLTCLSSNCVVTFANTHLVWQGTQIPDVRCMHAACCVKALSQYRHPMACGVVFCADFNAQPHTTTYAMLTTGGDFGNSIDEVKPFLDEYWGKEPPVTNLDGEFQDCLDYILFRTQTSSDNRSLKLIPSQVVDFLSVDEMRQNLPPSPVFPSDHLPLIATFILVKE
ncbi:hypothetical protein FSP39_000973 [Pinctada imbricata]|uniref:Endonuclease/exonuclease/phosphatase domain-containing protein n=1 Tax=Pinctada imbricata TaxID=66713 RepID=A0AA88Y6T8_PINIB|nr:hypothetical protein FSP39_000973 [Pinctada imbricata]